MHILHKNLISILLVIVFVMLVSPASGMERRRDQFIKEPGYYIIPVPIVLPGIGDALAVLGVISNAHDSYTDYAGFVIAGDIEGFGATASDIHLINKTLIAEVAAQDLSKVQIFSYNGRGMQTDKDDYSILELDSVQTATARLRGSFYDRMFEIQALGIKNEYHLASLRDNDGNLIMDTRDSEESEVQVYNVSLQLDWTDGLPGSTQRGALRYFTLVD